MFDRDASFLRSSLAYCTARNTQIVSNSTCVSPFDNHWFYPRDTGVTARNIESLQRARVYTLRVRGAAADVLAMKSWWRKKRASPWQQLRHRATISPRRRTESPILHSKGAVEVRAPKRSRAPDVPYHSTWRRWMCFLLHPSPSTTYKILGEASRRNSK